MISRLWIEFHNRKGDGRLGPAMGSEGFQPLDGRYSIDRATREAFDRAVRLERVQRYEAFRIMRGTTASNAYPVSPVVTL